MRKHEAINGWHSRGYLPHFDGAEITQFVTFRLADSLPQQLLDNWRTELQEEAGANFGQQYDGGLNYILIKGTDSVISSKQALLNLCNVLYSFSIVNDTSFRRGW